MGQEASLNLSKELKEKIQMKPKVYFKSILDSKDRKDCLRGLLYCLEPVLSEFKSGQIVGIKTTIGDSKGVTFTKPDIIRVLVERLKALKLKPFVFDTNVIYRGRRMNAVDHLNLAAGKGFSPQKLGCPFIIADGVFGTDSKAIEFKSKHLKDIRVPSLVGVLENLIVVSHVTGHMLSGYAASIKNVAMGMASRAGKQTQHSLLKPSVIKNKCTLCGCCMQICPVEAISEKQDKAFIDSSVCVGCGECISACKFDAIYINWQEDTNIFVERTSQKSIVIGKNGDMIKKIGKSARADIEELLSKHIYLDLWVKVQEKWKKDPNALKEMGYSD